MANTKVRGITLEIGGDTSGLSKALKGVNSEIKDTQKQLKDVENLLKLDPGNTELLAQKQKLLNDQVEETKNKLETLKDAQRQFIEDGGDVNSDGYMALQREIFATEQSLDEATKKAQSFSATLTQVGEAAKSVQDGANKVASATKGISTAAAGAVASLAGLAYSAVVASDDLNTLSKQTGISTADLQKMQYASDLIDVSVNDITSSLKKMKKNMDSTSGDVVDAWERLGVATKDENDNLRDSTQVFYETLDALSKIENETERDTIAMYLFGKSADSLAGIVDDGGKALKELGQQAEDLGLIMSQDTLDSLNELNDQIDIMKSNIQGTLAKTGAKAAEALAPVLEKIVGYVGKLLEYIGSLNEEQIETILVVASIVAAISPLASIIGSVAGAISSCTTMLQTVKPVLIGLGETFSGIWQSLSAFLVANPIVAIVAAVVAAVLLIYKYGEELKEKLNEFDKWLDGIFAKDMKEIFGDTLGGVLNGFLDNARIMWKSLKGIFEGIIDFVQAVFEGRWKNAWEAVKKIFVSIWDGFAEIAKKPINAVIELINKLIRKINTFIDKINPFISSLGSLIGAEWNIGKIAEIPKLAKGGVVKRGTAIVGEAGPELLSVGNGQAVVRPLTNAGTGLSGISVNMNNTFNGYTSATGAAAARDLVRQVNRALGRAY